MKCSAARHKYKRQPARETRRATWRATSFRRYLSQTGRSVSRGRRQCADVQPASRRGRGRFDGDRPIGLRRCDVLAGNRILNDDCREVCDVIRGHRLDHCVRAAVCRGDVFAVAELNVCHRWRRMALRIHGAKVIASDGDRRRRVGRLVHRPRRGTDGRDRRPKHVDEVSRRARAARRGHRYVHRCRAVWAVGARIARGKCLKAPVRLTNGQNQARPAAKGDFGGVLQPLSRNLDDRAASRDSLRG